MSYFDRPGPWIPVLFVHGLGNAASNFAALCDQPALAAHRLVAFDFPGCGASPYPTDRALTIDDLVDLVDAIVEHLALAHFLIVGASMGGLVALLNAERRPERLVGFLNAEGNLAPEDCMFSRLVVPHSYEHFEQVVFPEIRSALRQRDGRGFAEHLAVLERATPRAYYDFSFQTVWYSDNGGLLDRFLALPVPRHFVYGSANCTLSYLETLRASTCRMTEIAGADHFMFYDDPAAFAACVASAAAQSTDQSRRQTGQ